MDRFARRSTVMPTAGTLPAGHAAVADAMLVSGARAPWDILSIRVVVPYGAS